MSLPVPATTAPAWLVRAARRLNPALTLEVDVLAVTRADGASTYEEWNGGTKTNVEVSTKDGAVRLARGAARTLFSMGASAAAATVKGYLYSVPNSKQHETLWLDFYPDPAVVGPHGFTLHSLELKLGRGDGISYNGPFRITVAAIDGFWNRHTLGSPVELAAEVVKDPGSVITLNFLDRGHRFEIAVGQRRYTSGTGLDASGNDRQSPTGDVTVVNDRKWHSWVAPIGFSIGITADAQTIWNEAWVGLVPNGASYPQFSENAMWRADSTGQYDCGPYDPRVEGAFHRDRSKFPGDGAAQMGAAPGGFGTMATKALDGSARPYGEWGQSRQVSKLNKPHTAESNLWQQAYHVLKAVTYNTSGSVIKTFNLGAAPTEEVHFRADTIEPVGTSVTFALEGSANGVAWTSLGAVVDGEVVPGYQFYRLTATLAGSADGFATPALVAAFFTERTRHATFRYMRDVDATVRVDPVTGQSEIGELSLPLLKAGTRYADFVTRLATEYAPTRMEAWVYLRETIGGRRHFVNLFRLEDRDPSDGEEAFTFVSGMDRLKVKVPQARENYTYPTDGSLGVIASVSRNGSTQACTIGVTGTPFTSVALAGMRFQPLSGALTGVAYSIASNPAPTTSAFTIILDASDPTPAIGDTFRIHSDITERAEADFSGQDPAVAYADVLANHASVPARYRGALPPATGFTTTGRLTSDGREALGPLQELALLCGGVVAWRKGRIDFVDLYGDKDVKAVWDDRELVALTTPVGAGRRMPSVALKYDYDWGAAKFVREIILNDDNAVQGWGRANLFDVANLPEDLGKWCNAPLAEAVVSRMLRAWSTGVRIWKARTVTPWPWLTIGDGVTISTDQYTDRRMRFEGEVDAGEPVKGRVSAVGVIVGHNLWGDEFLVAIPGLDAIASVQSADGDIEGPQSGVACPPITLTQDDVGPLHYFRLPTILIAFTPPASPHFSHMEFAVEDDSGVVATEAEGATSPVRVRASWGVTYTVTPYAVSTTGTRTAGTPQTIAIPNNWRIGRELPFVNPLGQDDGYTLGASDSTGRTAHDDVKESGGKRVNRLHAKPLAGDPDTLDSVGNGFTYGRPLNTALTNGEVDLGKTGVIGKVAANLARSGGNATNLATILARLADTGHAASDMQESGGREVRRLLAKSLAGDADTLDGVPEGSTYRRTTLNEKTGAGRGYSALDASNRLTTEVYGTAKVAGLPARQVARQAHGVFLETWDGTDPADWRSASGGAAVAVVAGAGQAGGNVLRCSGTSHAWRVAPERIPFDPSKLYRMRARVRLVTAPTDPLKDYFFAGVCGYAADGITRVSSSGADSDSSQHYVCASNADLGSFALGTWVEYTGFFKGWGAAGSTSPSTDASAPRVLHQDVRYIAPLFIANYSGGDGVTDVDYLAIDVLEESGVTATWKTLDRTTPGRLLAAAAESGGRAVNRLLAKTLAGDTDDFDGLPEGITYKRTTANEKTGASRGYSAIDSGGVVVTGAVDFSRGYTGKHAGNLPRSGANVTPVGTILTHVADTGHAASTMQESGGKALNRLYAKSLAGDADTLDSVAEGTTYKRTTANEKTGAGRGFSAIDASGILVTSAIDFARTYTGKHLGNLPDDATSDRRAATANEKTGGARGFGGFTNATGGLVSTATESGGRAVNRLLAKALSGDADTLDGLPEGTTFKRTTANEKTGAARGYSAIDSGGVVVTGAVDFARAYNGKHAGNLPRSSGSAIATSAAIANLTDAGHAASAMQEAGGKALNRLYAKSLAGDADTADSIAVGVVRAPVAIGYVDAQLRPKQLARTDNTAITADQLGGALGDSPDNLIRNGGAQSSNIGEGMSIAGPWIYGAGEAFIADNAHARFGDRSMRCTHAAGAYSSTYQDGPTVSAGQVVALSLFVKPQGTAGAGVAGALLAIAGHEAAGAFTILGTVGDVPAWAGTTHAAATISAGTADWTPLHVIARANVSGPIRVYVVHGYGGNLSGTVYLDGIVVRKLDPNTPVGGARGAKGLTDDGEVGLNLPAGIGQRDGVAVRVLAKGHLSGTATHGAVVAFPQLFQNVPSVRIWGGKSYEPRAIQWVGGYDANAAQYDDVAADGLGVSGFAVRARLIQKSAVTNRAHNFAANSLTTEGASIARNLDNAPAGNDTYTAHFRVDVTANAAVNGPRNTVMVVVAVDLDKGLGGGYQEVATKTYAASANVGAADVKAWAHELLSATLSGVTNAGDIRLRIKDITLDANTGGGSVTVHAFDGAGGDPASGVTYSTATISYTQKTTDIDDVVHWEAIEVS